MTIGTFACKAIINGCHVDYYAHGERFMYDDYPTHEEAIRQATIFIPGE